METLGAALWAANLDRPLGSLAAWLEATGMGGAAAYLPCEASLGAIGIAAAFGPVAAASGQSPVLHTGPLPIGACRRIRHGAAEAEVWPGSWQLDHVTVHDPDTAA